MRLIRFPWPSVRIGAVIAVLAGAALLIGACGGDDDEEPPPEATAETTPIPTATPLASVPAPTIVATATPAATSEASQPAASGEEIEYEVEAGDTLSAIAAEFDTTIEAIMERNDIEDAALIFVGQKLIVQRGYVPEGSDDADDGAADSGDEADDSGSETTTDESGARIYVVQAGDTAYGIALQFDVTLEELAAANGTTVDALSNLFEGEELIIP